MLAHNYYLGLDIGTDSVGWAVTDETYHIVKKSGKALWGVRLFDSANTAAERRSYRTSRRRVERRKNRIKWLQNIFSEEIAKADPAFFIRLQESKFLEEDKQAGFPLGRYTLFADKNYSDKDYHREYPTIYHLRKALMEEAQPFDVRLVYLALHHILKYRGHFLYGDLSMETVTVETGLARLNLAMEQEYGKSLIPSDIQKFKDVLISRTGNKTQRKKQLSEIFSISKKEEPNCYSVIELLSGSSVSLDALYGEGTATDEIKKVSLEDEFENIEGQLNAAAGDRIELILAAKEIYDWAILETLRDGEQYLSVAKVKSYEKHRDDLALLKTVAKELNDPELYRKIFHYTKKELNNYPAYSGKGAGNHRCGYDDFSKFVQKELTPYLDSNENIEKITLELKQGTFLPLQKTKDNGVIPHQLHEAELEIILKNASQYLPFLAETDESGLSKAQQIHEMFCFRIPYYVGPMDSRSQHSWVARKNEKVYPWNFEKVVDLEECRHRFIRNMTAKCSYIGEDILPKESLLYTRFQMLNELNNLKINGEAITVKQKQDLYNELLVSGKNISKSKIRAFFGLGKEDELTGLDGDIKATLLPWKHYDWLIKLPRGIEIAEDIILHITLFGDDRKLLAAWLHKTYGQVLSKEDEKQALKFKCSGWGRLSRIFLTEIYHTDIETGEAKSIIDMLWETNDNLMKLLSRSYNFNEAVQAYREQTLDKNGYTLKSYLEESYASQSIKRAIHQVISIVSELEGIMKCPPKRVFVEMARGDGTKGKRTVTRKAELTALYEKCGEDSGLLFQQLSDEPDGNLRRDKLYLYYTQLGKCMYSGEPIDLSRLDSDYDIDHIYPQSKIKDDSIQNRVLVKRELNAMKSDRYPIGADIRAKMKPFWMLLKGKGFISQDKYQRLTRKTGFTADEQADFINRQLVETRQSSKLIAELLKRRFHDQTEIVYVKAGNVSGFRQEQRITEEGKQMQAGQCKLLHTKQDPLFVKCREINDFHHAKDAYLNIVVGNVYHVKFTRNPLSFIKQEHGRYSLNRMFDFDVCRSGEQAWKAGTDGSIAVVRQAMQKNNILFTRRAAEVTGGLFDQNIMPKGQGQRQIKSSDSRMKIERYGGYNKLSGAYFALVEHTDKKKRVRSLEPVLLIDKAFYENDPEGYCRDILELEEPRVLVKKIKINSLMSFDGFKMHISGRTGNQIIYKNANQLVLPPEWQQYIKNLSKYLARCKAVNKDLEITVFDGIEMEKNNALYAILLEKLEKTIYNVKHDTPAKALREHMDKFTQLSISEQCRTLLQILNLFRNTAASADLKLLNGKAQVGNLRTSKNLNNDKSHSIKLIHQSVTGFFQQEIDLLSGDFV